MARKSHGRRRPAEGDEVSRNRQHQKYSEAIYEVYDRRCWLCGGSGADTIDHLVPVLWGGSDHPSNLKPAHRSCNSSKGADKPDKECWTVPTMWLEGYGPNSRGIKQVYPRPTPPSLSLILATFVLSVAAVMGGRNFGYPGLIFGGVSLAVGFVAITYLRWWWWIFTSHRLVQAAEEDVTPVEPAEWLTQAQQRPPGLRQIKWRGA